MTQTIKNRLRFAVILLWCALFLIVIIGTCGILLKLQIDQNVLAGNDEQRKQEMQIVENQKGIVKNQIEILRRLDNVEQKLKSMDKLRKL